MRIRRAVAAMLCSAFAMVLVSAPTFASGGTTRMVDTDGRASAGNCAGSGFAFKKIQKAIDASTSGDTVLVCPGTYEEQVAALGLSNFTLKSVDQGAATIKTPSVLAADYLVGLGEGNNISFQGFTLAVRAGDGSNCQQLGEAILVADTVGSEIRANRIRATGGLTLGPCGYVVGIQVGLNGPFGSPPLAHRTGFSPAGPTPPASRATVDYNAVRDFIGAGIVVGGDPHARSLITRNSVRFLHETADASTCGSIPLAPGIAATAGIPRMGVPSLMGRLKSAMKTVVPGGTTSSICFAFGIIEGEGGTGYIVNNRVLSGPHSAFGTPRPVSTTGTTSPTAALFVGILQLVPGTGVGRTSVTDNAVFRTLAGVGGLAADNTTISGNFLHENILGVFLGSTVGATVNDNIAHNNAVGIGINDEAFPVNSVLSHDNTVTGNHVLGNFINSCFDNTTGGTGSYGTDDTWSGNTAEDNSSDPWGICGQAVV